MAAEPRLDGDLLAPPAGSNMSSFAWTMRCVAFVVFCFPRHRPRVRVPCLRHTDWEAHAGEIASVDLAGWVTPYVGRCTTRGCHGFLHALTDAGRLVITASLDPEQVERSVRALRRLQPQREPGIDRLEQVLRAASLGGLRRDLSQFAAEIREADCPGNREARHG